MQLFGYLMDGAFSAHLNDITQLGYTRMSDYIQGPLKIAFTLYMVLVGYESLKSSNSELVHDLPFKMMRMGFIWLLMSNWANFCKPIYDGLMEAYQTLGSYVAFGTYTPIGTGLDQSFSAAIDTGMAMIARGFFAFVGMVLAALATSHAMSGIQIETLGNAVATPGPLVTGAVAALVAVFADASGIGSVTDVLVGLAYLLCTAIFHAIAFYTLLMVQITMALVLIFAPLFISMYLFTTTKPIAESWLRTVIGILLTPAGVMITLSITQQLTVAILADAGTGPGIGLGDSKAHALLLLVWLGMAFFLLEVPSFISGMVGSLSGGASGARVVSVVAGIAQNAAMAMTGLPGTGGGAAVAGGAAAGGAKLPPNLMGSAPPAAKPAG